MSAWLSAYLGLNLMLAVGLLFVAVAGRILSRAASQLRLHYAVLTLCLVGAALIPFLPAREGFKAILRVGAEPTKPAAVRLLPEAAVMPARPVRGRSPPLAPFALLWLIPLARLAWSLRRLEGLRRAGYPLRRLGRVAVYASPEVAVPLSYWRPGRAVVLLPVGGPSRLALAHELQHHRQGDTRWVYLMWALRAACFANPAVHLWSSWLDEIQEFACDETLLDRGKVELRAYTRCLVEAALAVNAGWSRPVGATGLFFPGRRRSLMRRIEKMQTYRKSSWPGALQALTLAATLLLAGTAFASRGLVQDRRISLQQARDMVKASTFPVVVNDRVLKWLNYDLGTFEGRGKMRAALARMELYRPMLEGKARQYGAPNELLAVPIVESGYQNLAQGHRTEHGAGLWMFIASTARRFGMHVDLAQDERLNPLAETDAAMRYLTDNKRLFADWRLALMAYNVGEARVQEGIDKTGSRDAWVLVQAGYENDTDYLAKVMAAVLVLQNPGAVN